MVNWAATNLVPKAGLEAWHDAASITGVANGGVITTVPDSSGNSRTVSVSANKPTLNTSAINGNPSIVFSGSNNALAYTGNFSFQHLFVVGAYADPTFIAGLVYPTLINAKNYQILIGDGGNTSNFYNTSSPLGGFVYRRRDVVLVNTAMTASFSGAISIFEIVLPASVSLTGIEIGNGPSMSTNAWKGPICETLMYSRALSEFERIQIYEYFAMRYWLWQQTAAGLDVFPFVADRSRTDDLDIERYVSTPYSGPAKTLERGSPLNSYSLNYTTRRQEEYDAAKQFWLTHRRPTECALRDFRFYPARDTKGIITSSLREQGSNVSYRFNYVFDFMET